MGRECRFGLVLRESNLWNIDFVFSNFIHFSVAASIFYAVVALVELFDPVHPSCLDLT